MLGLTTLLISPGRIPKLGALVRPATLLKFHKALVERKYRLLVNRRRTLTRFQHCPASNVDQANLQNYRVGSVGYGFRSEERRVGKEC